MSNTVEDLLKPRVKLTNDYYGNIMPVGSILEQWDGNVFLCKQPYVTIKDPLRFPANFSELPWYADRNPEEMPEYLKSTHSGKVVKVDRYDPETNTLYFDGGFPISMTHMLKNNLPATLDEYITYQQSSKK